MPNWCQNEMDIIGSKKEIERFVENVKGEEYQFDFNKIIPMPVIEENNWYDWCCDNWGTKWNACDIEISEIEKISESVNHQIRIFFNTAWSYPSGIFEKIAQDYPKLKFNIKVDEEGGFFWGIINIKKGVVSENLQQGVRVGGPYDFNEDE